MWGQYFAVSKPCPCFHECSFADCILETFYSERDHLLIHSLGHVHSLLISQLRNSRESSQKRAGMTEGPVPPQKKI